MRLIPRLTLVALACLALGCDGSNSSDGGTGPSTVTVSSVTISPSPLALTGLGVTGTLSASVLGSIGPISNPTVTWSSSNTAIADVSGSGATASVTSRGNGSATITATSGGKSATATVNVQARLVSITFSPPTASVRVGSTTTLAPNISADPGVPTSLTYSTSDASKATVTNAGVVTGVAPGQATITARSTYDQSVSATVTVTVVAPVTSVSITPQTVNVRVGATGQVTANVVADAGVAQTVTWSSSAPAVASVGGSGNTATIVGLTAGVTYAIATSTVDASKKDSARVTVAAACGPATSVGTLTAFTTVSSSLGTTDCQRSDNGAYARYYRYTVSSPTQVQIDLTSTAFDAFLQVVDANGSVVTSNDNGGGGTNARISTALNAGTYYVVATSAAAGATGAFQLTLLALTPCTGSTIAGTISIGQTVAGTLSATDCVLSDNTFADVYQINVTSTTSVQIDMTSSAFDTYLLLTDQSGNVIASNDNGSGTTNARIRRTLAPGLYYIFANEATVGATGAYQLSVNAISPLNDRCSLNTFTPIATGQTLGGTLAATDCVLNDGSFADIYRLTVSSTTQVQIDLTSSAFDTFLYLYDQNGAVITSNDDVASGNTNSRITRTLTPGTYYIGASSLVVGATGAYQISVR